MKLYTIVVYNMGRILVRTNIKGDNLRLIVVLDEVIHSDLA